MPVSTVTFIIIILSALAALVFAGGFIRGVKNAINGFRNPSEDKETPVEQNGHWGS